MLCCDTPHGAQMATRSYVTVYVTHDLLCRLEAEARRRGVSVSRLCRGFLEAGLAGPAHQQPDQPERRGPARAEGDDDPLAGLAVVAE